MQQYLRPRTLFGVKFDDYLNEKMPKEKSSEDQPQTIGVEF